eukprot:6192031-Pleurochrysis_carterae.AAC.4
MRTQAPSRTTRPHLQPPLFPRSCLAMDNFDTNGHRAAARESARCTLRDTTRQSEAAPCARDKARAPSFRSSRPRPLCVSRLHLRKRKEQLGLRLGRQALFNLNLEPPQQTALKHPLQPAHKLLLQVTRLRAERTCVIISFCGNDDTLKKLRLASCKRKHAVAIQPLASM